MAVTESSESATSQFEFLLTPIIEKAYVLALHLTCNPADAEDLVQDAALLAFRGFSSFEPGTNFKAWYFRILTNCFRSAYRKRRRQPGMVGLEDASEIFLYRQGHAAGVSMAGANPEATILGQIDAEQTIAALHSLPENFRVVATLYFIEDFSYQQIAEVLELPVGTVRSRLHRGRRMLQKRLWQLAQDDVSLAKAQAS